MGERKVLNKHYTPDFDPAKIPRRRKDKKKTLDPLHPPLPAAAQFREVIPPSGEEEKEGRMGERKVLNKYYPPDFDPAKIPRRRKGKNKKIKVRMMHPMRTRCNTCGNYIGKGTKFSSLKESVICEMYRGILISRFYFKCTNCSAELTMKTDPQNSDYVVEAGATHNFEPWRNEEEAIENLKRKRDAEEIGDAMKTLENKTLDSKQEMDILATLEEIKSINGKGAVGYPTDSLSKTSIFNSSETGGGVTLLPKLKFIVKLPSTANAVKKPRLEPAEDNKAKDEQIKNEQPKVVEKTNGLQFICENYDGDESE